MKKENAILFNTKKECYVCSKGYVLVKFTKHTASFRNGPFVVGGITSYETITNTAVTYFCGECGIVFLPTSQNRLSENVESYEKDASKMFEKTAPHFLTRDLLLGEVFEEIEREGLENHYLMIEHDSDLSLFKEGTLVRTIRANDRPGSIFENSSFNEGIDLCKRPYIVLTTSGYELVWWAKHVRRNLLLTKDERAEKRKALKARLSKLETERDTINEKNKGRTFKQKISAVSAIEIPSLQNEIKNLKSATKLVFADNDPLPEGAIMAELVLVLDFFNRSRGFYVPANTLG